MNQKYVFMIVAAALTTVAIRILADGSHQIGAIVAGSAVAVVVGAIFAAREG